MPLEESIVNSYSEAQQKLRQIMANYPYIVHPYGAGALTTNGVQYGAAITGSSGITTGTSADIIMATATIVVPGSSAGHVIDEMELGLTLEMKATTAGTTLKYIWEAKNSTEGTTWQTLHSIGTYVTTAANTYYSKTHSGYGGNANLTKPNLNIRLRMWNKKASVGVFRVKNSSYVAIKVKRQ